MQENKSSIINLNRYKYLLVLFLISGYNFLLVPSKCRNRFSFNDGSKGFRYWKDNEEIGQKFLY